MGFLSKSVTALILQLSIELSYDSLAALRTQTKIFVFYLLLLLNPSLTNGLKEQLNKCNRYLRSYRVTFSNIGQSQVLLEIIANVVRLPKPDE